LSKLLLVRHGNTKLNSTERYWGQTDVELSTTGIRQAERLRDRLAAQAIDAIYSSNLCRALVTAKIITSDRPLDIITCAELREINFGEIEGLTFKEVSQLYPEVSEAWFKWSLTLKYPGGESIVEFNNRISKFLERLEKHTPEETVLIVAHSASLRLLICHLLGIGIQYWRQIRLDLASLSVLDTYPQGAILSLLNDISHLE